MGSILPKNGSQEFATLAYSSNLRPWELPTTVNMALTKGCWVNGAAVTKATA